MWKHFALKYLSRWQKYKKNKWGEVKIISIRKYKYKYKEKSMWDNRRIKKILLIITHTRKKNKWGEVQKNLCQSVEVQIIFKTFEILL
jgi:hypothetical protein